MNKYNSLIKLVEDSDEKNFIELSRLAQLDPVKDFRFADWSHISFAGCDFSGYDLSYSKIEGSSFKQSKIANLTIDLRNALRPELRAAADYQIFIQKFEPILDSFGLACTQADIEGVAKFLSLGVDVNFEHGERTALITACARGHLDLCVFLIKAGADVNLAGRRDGWTPLMQAAAYGHLEICRLLIEKGADVRATKSDDGRTALHLATDADSEEIIVLLVSNGADVDATSNFVWSTPLEIASKKKLRRAHNLLKKLGAKS